MLTHSYSMKVIPKYNLEKFTTHSKGRMLLANHILNSEQENLNLLDTDHNDTDLNDTAEYPMESRFTVNSSFRYKLFCCT